MKLVVVALLVVICVLQSDCALLPASLQHELLILKGQVVVLNELLVSECPGYTKIKRQLSAGFLEADIRVQKILYERLIRELLQCQERTTERMYQTTEITRTTKGIPSTTSVKTTEITRTTKGIPSTTAVKTTEITRNTKGIPSTTAVKTTEITRTTKRIPSTTAVKTTEIIRTTKGIPSTTAVKTTSSTAPSSTPTMTTDKITKLTTTVKGTTEQAEKLQPKECLTATNLTESWRMDHNGSDHRPGGPLSHNGYACDWRRDLQWFRFTGAAGNRMLNTCPKSNSCGTLIPYWTDAVMPGAEGVATTVDMYGVRGTNCKSHTYPLQVMRCSWDTGHDLIYRQTKYDWSLCNIAFCGMM